MTSPEEDLEKSLERIYTHLGTATTDEQLETTINKFLIPAIFKISTVDKNVKHKIVEILSHINRRIKRSPNVQLPVGTLLTHYINPDASNFVVNFTVVYIRTGFSRLPLEKKIELLPLLITACGRKHKIHQDSLFSVLTSMVVHLKDAAEKENHRKFFKLDENPELMRSFCSYMLDVILLPYTQPSQLVPSENLDLSASQFVQIPPGMSLYGYKRVTAGDQPMTGEHLEELKMGILKFLATGILPAEDVICHFIIGSSDPRYMVAEYAGEELKKFTSNVDWKSTALASRLFYIYLGSPEELQGREHPIPPENRVVPGSTRIRLKIIPFLGKLEDEAFIFPLIVKVVFATLNQEQNLRLRIHVLNFALGIIRRVKDNVIKRSGGSLYSGLLKLVFNDSEHVHLRIAGYTVVGQIVKKMPHVIKKNLKDLQIFFEKLDHHRSEIRMAARDALVTMIDSYRLFLRNVEIGTNYGNDAVNMDQDSTDEDDANGLDKVNRELKKRELRMLEFLASHVESQISTARLIAAKYLSALFDTDHPPSRCLLLLAVGDPDPDISSFALKALYTDVEWGDYEDRLIPLPDFLKMLESIDELAKIRIQNEDQRVAIQNVVSPFCQVVFDEILTFLRLCMAQSSSIQLISKEDMYTHPCEYSPSIRRYILEVNEKNPTLFDYYLRMIEMLLLPYVSEVTISCVAEVIGTCPDIFTDRFAPRFQQFMNFLTHTIDGVKDNVGFIISVVAIRTMDEEKLDETIKILLKKLEDRSTEVQKGAIFALGHIFHGKIAPLTRNGIQYDLQSRPLYQEIFFKIVRKLDEPDTPLTSAVCVALSLIMKSVPLPLPEKALSGLSKYSVFKTLLDITNSGKLDSRTKERAIRACGIMCIGDKFPFPEELIEKLVDISKQAKEIETQLSIAESIIFCLEGTSSPEKRDVWIMDESDYVRPPIPEENLYLLNTLLDELTAQVATAHHNFRQAICIFLVLILKKFYFTENVKSRLPNFQLAFMELLCDNELVQDIAAKGLAFVYEVTPPQKKEELVKTLVNELLSNKNDVQVSRDRRLFEEVHLINTNLGSLITYKEICILATEINHPELVYKFMNLANQNVTWNSRKGAVLGFHATAKNSEDGLNKHLPQIIPRLYRYQYDPSPRVQSAMTNIWRSLVKNNVKALKTYFQDILKDLAAKITSEHSRVRLSCASALCDLFGSDSNVLEAAKRLPRLMSALYKVMDDVHEPTRKAAQSAAKNIAKYCASACETKMQSMDAKTLRIIISTFQPGLISSVPEVRSLCIRTIAQMVDSIGAAVKPILPILMVSLLHAAGDLDSSGKSYLTANRLRRVDGHDMIEDVRANISKRHYSIETISKCIPFMEMEMLGFVVPRALLVIQNGTSGSKIAAAYMFVLLTEKMKKHMEFFMGKILSALLSGLLDKNPTVRKTFACHLGEVLQAAKPTSLEKLFKKISIWYFEKEDSHIRTTIPVFLQSAAIHNAEIIRNHFHNLIPMIFFAIHEKKIEGENNARIIMWEELWNEISLGYEITIKGQFDEILDCLEESLLSLSWSTKAQAGRCIQTIAVKVRGGIDTERRDRLIAMSLRALEGKTFKGKEDIIYALEKVCTYAGDGLNKKSMSRTIADAFLRESKKAQIIYGRHSVQALGRVLEKFDHLDYFQKVYDLSRSIIGKSNEPSGEEDKSQNINLKRKEMIETINVIYVCLGKSWPRRKQMQLSYQDILLNECYDSLDQSPRDVQFSILVALYHYVDKLYYFSPEYKFTYEGESALRDILQKVTIALHYALGISTNEKIRKVALNITAVLGKRLIWTGRDRELVLLAEFLRFRMQELEKDNSPDVRMRLVYVKEILKR